MPECTSTKSEMPCMKRRSRHWKSTKSTFLKWRSHPLQDPQGQKTPREAMGGVARCASTNSRHGDKNMEISLIEKTQTQQGDGSTFVTHPTTPVNHPLPAPKWKYDEASRPPRKTTDDPTTPWSAVPLLRLVSQRRYPSNCVLS